MPTSSPPATRCSTPTCSTAADRGIAARHGELVASGWRAAHVTVTAGSGVRAGEEIVDWFAAALAAAR